MLPPCEECPLNKPGKVLVKGQFPPLSEWNGLLIVGEQPWKVEAKKGTPFVGPSGKLLRSICASRGLDVSQARVVNAMSCFAGDWPAGDKGNKLKEQGCKCCRDNLLKWSQLSSESQRPRVILSLGVWAYRSLTGDWGAKIDEFAGSINEINGSVLIPSIHPSRVLRGGGQEADVLSAHVHKVLRAKRGELVQWKDSYQLAPSVERLREFVEFLEGEGGRFACDVETVPPPGQPYSNRWTAQLRVIGIGTADWAAVIPFGEEAKQFYSPDEWKEVLELLKRLMAGRTEKIFHNMQYDIPVLVAHGLFRVGDCYACHDTMIAHKTIFMKGIRHNLAYCAGMYLDTPAWKSEFAKEWEAPLRELALYNSRDVRITAQLWEILEGLLKSNSLMDAYELDRRNTEIAWKESYAGWRLDHKERDRLLEEKRRKAASGLVELLELSGIPNRQREIHRRVLEQNAEFYTTVKIADLCKTGLQVLPLKSIYGELHRGRKLVMETALKRKLEKYVERVAELPNYIEPPAKGDKEARAVASKQLQTVRGSAKMILEVAQTVPLVNLRSDAQTGEVIHETLGLTAVFPKVNGGREYAVGKDALYHVSRHEFVAGWQGWKHLEKQIQWLEDIPIFPDGIIHQVYKSHTTPSCRYAGGGGDTAKDPLERFNPQNIEWEFFNLFLPPPGCVMVGGDFSTLELRVAGAITNCRRMIGQLRNYDEGRADDLHTQMAKAIFPNFDEQDEKRRKFLRGVAKTANFLSIYGGSSEALFTKLRTNMPPETSLDDQMRADENLRALAKEVQTKLGRTWVEMFSVMERWLHEARGRGVLKTGYVTGRVVRFPLRDRKHVLKTEVFNLPVQTTARELVCRAADEIDRRLPKGAALCADVHDALAAYCLKEQADEVLGIFQEAMSTEFMGVRIIGEPQVGENLLVVK